MRTAVIGAGPAGLLFALVGKIMMGDAWSVALFDKRERYERTHRLRLAPEPYLALAKDLEDPRFDAFAAFLKERHFSPEVNLLEQHLSLALARMGVTKTVREITTLDGLDADTIVAADSVRSAMRELVRGDVTPERRTHEQVVRLRVTGEGLPARLSAVDQFRLSKVLGSVVDYRRNDNGFAEVDLFVTEEEHARAFALGGSPKEPVEIDARAIDALSGTLLRAVVLELARPGRKVLVYSTFRLEHVVMPRVSFEAFGKRVFLLGDAAVSLPFFRGMACLASCAHALARAHASGLLDAYEADVRAIVKAELATVRSRARLVRGLRELVRLSSMLPFPIQSWWLSAARDPVPDALSPGASFNLAIAVSAAALAALGLVSPWLALLSLPAELAGGFAYRWTLRLEPGPHRYLRRIWEVQVATLLVAGMALAVARRAPWPAAALWWVLGAAFAAGIYAWEVLIGRSLTRAQV